MQSAQYYTCNKILMFTDLLRREIQLSVGVNDYCKGKVLHVYINKDFKSFENIYILIKCKLYSNFYLYMY